MEKFVDLNLHLPVTKHERWEVEELVKRSAELGYSSIGVPIPTETSQKEIEDVEKVCNENNLDLIERADLKPRNARELLSLLRTLRRKREVIAVHCESKSIARQAAKDRRVDLIYFSGDPRGRFFDSAEAELASKVSVALEIHMALLLTLNGFMRVRLISRLRREVAIAQKFNVPVVISSGTADKYLLRRPQDHASLAYLFGMDHQAAVKAISEAPLKIIERNREKLSPNYVAPGVYTVRGGEDCPGA